MKLGLRTAFEVGCFVAWAAFTAGVELARALLENAADGYRDWRDERIARAR